MSVAAALSSPLGSNIARFVISRVLPTAITAVAAPQLAVPMLVAGGVLAAQAAWYYWSDANRKAIQDKAIDKYCTANPSALMCGVVHTRYQSANPGDDFDRVNIQTYPEKYKALGSLIYMNRYGQFVENGTPGARAVQNIEFSSNNRLAFFGTATLFRANATTWDKLSDADRKAAIDLLTEDDWRDEVSRMIQGGTLSDGQVLSSPAMLLDNAREIPSNSRVLNSADASVVEAVMDRLKPLQDKVDDLAAIIAAAGLVGVGAKIASQGNVLDGVNTRTKEIASSVDAMKTDMNNNFNKVRKRLSGIASFLNFDRILNVLIWWQTLHNCFMLSADVSRSLVSAFSTVLKALPGDSLLGLPTESEDGSPLDLATTINSSVETWVKGAIGAENYVQMKTTLAEINRIYQSTANGVFLIQGSIQAMHSITEAIGERVGRVGNALKRFGVIGEKAYAHMSENMNTRTAWIDRLQERAGNVQTAISSVEQIAQSVVSIQDNIVQLKAQKQQIDNSLQKLDIVEAPDNEATKARSEAEKSASVTPNIDRIDTIRPSELAA